MTIDEMKARKKEMGLSYEQIAKLSGLPLGTVQKVLGGITKAPRFDTIAALEKVFQINNGTMSSMVCEPNSMKYDTDFNKEQGRYTIADYFNLPSDRRVELIDGNIYDMAAPSVLHQLLLTQIWAQFFQYIEKNNGECIPIVAPIDVQLDSDDKTMVQPDMVILCDRDKMGKYVHGSPDLVIEILSPASRKIDNKVKTVKYARAGVKEYWIVDPEKRKVLVENFKDDQWPVVYGFADKIPVNIFSDRCEIDFSKIYEYVKFMYED